AKNSRREGNKAPPIVFRRFEAQGIIWEIQAQACLSQRYRTWRRCVQCISKTSGDTCRFMGFRALPCGPVAADAAADKASDSNTTETDLSYAFVPASDADVVMSLPERPLSADLLPQVQAIVAESLLPVLEAELRHAELPDTLRRQRETTCRQMCDVCATSIFSASWYCRRCGREYCPGCKADLDNCSSLEPWLAKKLGLCDRTRAHSSEDLLPLTRLDRNLLRDEIEAMRSLLATAGERLGQKPRLPSQSDTDADAIEQPTVQSSGASVPKANVDWAGLDPIRAGVEADRVVGSLPLRAFDSLSEEDFPLQWAAGEPLLVRSVTGPMQHTWDPSAFVERYGDDQCHIVRSDGRNPPVPKQVCVGAFFQTFGTSREEREDRLGKGSWKLKDWPPSAEFKEEFPELYEDFNRAVPAPIYTTREGALNLGSYYPPGVMQPDLGPKMYNAWPASEARGGHGTTRLHMDMADAVNIMLYAAPPPDRDDLPEEHRSGVAAWDIFRAEDADTIRQFLREEHKRSAEMDDPIHVQEFFIDAAQRVKLFSKYGVRGWRIYQKTGEAVFIPAGCAHQVCNLADCIKVAVDFVSPHNVARCFKLTSEFRGLLHDNRKAWKEDVLSLRTTLWYAWCAYRQMDNRGPN
ncbi:hypothetical protein BCV70DRAFT_147026, partial [Testicularia cyperi]